MDYIFDGHRQWELVVFLMALFPYNKSNVTAIEKLNTHSPSLGRKALP
jgi:hypothetical protein